MLMSEPIRLQKALAQAGIASRRMSEILIEAGRVQVNGQQVVSQGTRVDPTTDVIKVDGKRIPPLRPHRYLVLNKPLGVISSMGDARGRPNVADYLNAESDSGIFHVGRLDADTEGLLLLTNDGEFGKRMTHPSYEVPKTYLVQVRGELANRSLGMLLKGIELDDGVIKADAAKIVDRFRDRTLIQVVLHSGRNRIVRRMFDALGHPVTQLFRTAIGEVRIGKLASGGLRELKPAELASLFDLVGM
ncbi:MAG: rRNA pseudouridine synthase [Propionibacteriaceae bacterium]|nr:rRNA pseudouridine synthase [Propionibacteriaceae bacterium]